MFDQIIAFNNLVTAYYKARKNKRQRKALLYFELDFEKQLLRLHKRLKDGSYQPKQYRQFLSFEPKVRQISAPAFIDRIVHHAINSCIEPIFDKQFISSSFACRKN
jgi:RNA-directed DNA polymerase